MGALAQERQITFSPKNHMLDNNDNFLRGRPVSLLRHARDDRPWHRQQPERRDGGDCDRRGDRALRGQEPDHRSSKPRRGLRRCRSRRTGTGSRSSTGRPSRRSPRAATTANPTGTAPPCPPTGPNNDSWLDHRDVASGVTPPGAHRGGTHRHEFCLDGSRIRFHLRRFPLAGIRSDRRLHGAASRRPGRGDALLRNVLVPVPKMGESKPGEVEKAYGDSWVGRDGTMRAFIGKVRNDDGETYTRRACS
jgi:hypothetical protein